MGGVEPAPRRWGMRLRPLVEPALVVLTVAALGVGGIAWLAGWRVVADRCWMAGTLVAVVPAVVWVPAALRRGRVGVDLIAVLSLVGTLLVGEYLAGALIAVMLAGGRALDAAAERRASHDLRALLEHAPRFARRRVGSEMSVIPLAEVAVDDLLVVGPGEVVPVDGRIVDTVAVLDESVLTGEPLQVERGVGEPVRSGVVNAGTAFELRATATAQDSTSAGIVRLAEEAGAENAPIVRLADRYAAWFLPVALLVAGAAWWASGSAVRAVAVLVVATPCPLLLAAPVDQMSPHVLAEAIVTEALARGLQLSLPSDVAEQRGQGVTARIGEHRVQVGKLPGDAVGAGWARAAVNRASLDSAAIVWVCIDEEPAGAVLLRDPLRRNAPRTVRRLRGAGLNRLVMLTGDRAEPAREVAAVLGLDEVYAEQSPADKVAAVRAERDRAVTVMVGDGVNDAPALAAATVGVAMGARGGVLRGRRHRVDHRSAGPPRRCDGYRPLVAAHRRATRRVGMSLSLGAMVIAALGFMPPAAGALLQEGIDVAVILNALRALRGNPAVDVELPADTEKMLRRFAAEHDSCATR